MANGNSLENTAVVENLTDEERLDQLEQEGNIDTEVLLFDKQIPASATILIDNKPYDYKDIKAQVDAGAYGKNINSVDDYVNAFGDRASVKVGRDLMGQEITEERATMVDKPRVEDSVSEWSKKYGKNFTVDQMEVEFQTYANAINLNDSQQSDVDSFINEEDPNYDPNLLKPRAPERFTMEMATAVTPVIQPYQDEFNQAKKYLESGPKKKGDKPATRDEIENNSNIDTSQPYVVIQAEDGVDTQNNAVKEALRKKIQVFK